MCIRIGLILLFRFCRNGSMRYVGCLVDFRKFVFFSDIVFNGKFPGSLLLSRIGFREFQFDHIFEL